MHTTSLDNGTSSEVLCLKWSPSKPEFEPFPLANASTAPETLPRISCLSRQHVLGAFISHKNTVGYVLSRKKKKKSFYKILELQNSGYFPFNKADLHDFHRVETFVTQSRSLHVNKIFLLNNKQREGEWWNYKNIYINNKLCKFITYNQYGWSLKKQEMWMIRSMKLSQEINKEKRKWNSSNSNTR